jgi:integrase
MEGRSVQGARLQRRFFYKGEHMASISTNSAGNRTIQFMAADKRRRTIRLGDANMADAREIKRRVESLNKAKRLNSSVENGTLEWLAGAGVDLYEKLVKVGLAPKRTTVADMALGAFIDGYLGKRTDIKPRTRENLNQVRRNLVTYFGADKQLADVTEGDADDWRLWLASNCKLGDNTIRRHCGRARQLFRAAVKRRLITSNPFGEMKGIAVLANEAREFFISRDVANKVLAVCPDNQWRLLFALSRFGGLRCPSEHLALRWGDVNWELGRLTIHSPKTEHHEGKSSRVIPIFPELRPYLEAAFDEAEENTFWAITRYRDANSNLRTQLQRIIAKAGLTAWPKLFQNLRSTRQTELAEKFPAHVVCKWLGNSEIIARKHYLQVTDAHFEEASGALQKALQSGTDSTEPQRTKPTGEPDADSKTAEQSEPVYVSPARTSSEQLIRYPRQDSNLQPPA